jgi:excisionase family DNA binding protein
MQQLPMDPAQRLFDLQEGARVLGLSVPTLRALIRRGELPCVRIGPRLLLDKMHLEQFIQAHTQRWAPIETLAANARKGHRNRRQRSEASHTA